VVAHLTLIGRASFTRQLYSEFPVITISGFAYHLFMPLVSVTLAEIEPSSWMDCPPFKSFVLHLLCAKEELVHAGSFSCYPSNMSSLVGGGGGLGRVNGTKTASLGQWVTESQKKKA
jgi:hypothetical protein